MCFCGRCFPAAVQDVKLKANSAIEKSSHQGSYRDCNFVKGNSLKGVCFSNHVVKLKKSPEIINLDSCNYLFSSELQAAMKDLFRYENFRVSLIFLKNLSIRC